MSRKTKYDSYGDRFKATAVELGALPGVKAIEIAEVLDIHPIMLYRWKKELRDGDIMKKTNKGTLETEQKSELKRLRKLEKIRKSSYRATHQTRSSKKKHPILFGSKKEIFAFIDKQKMHYKLKTLCEVYDVSRYGYYAWKSRGQSSHTKRDIELAVAIERLYSEYDGIYGSPKIHELLQQSGIVTGQNRVARLMQENDLKARCSRIYRNHTKMDRFYGRIKNKICDLEATGPDQIWVGDVTYLRVNDQWRYLAVIMDKFSRKIVGWSLSAKRNVDLTLTAFKRATHNRLLQAKLYFHSDRGAEYVAGKYQAWLKKNGVIQSMNRKGVMNDNAEMESFFHQFKAERIHKNDYTTEKELRSVIIEYVGFYNQKRIHSSLGYLTPNDFEVIMG